MARRKLIWHLGLADAARQVVPAGLDHHREALASLGVQVAADRDEAARGTHELLRTHAGVGLRRRDVEGQWARTADRVWAHRGTSVVSTPQLCAADKDQLRLALDPLIGVEVHLVVTVEPLLDQLYGAWVAELLSGARTGSRKHARRVQLPLAEPGAGNGQSERFWAGHELGSVLARWGWTLHADRLHVLAGDAETQWARLLAVAGLAPSELRPVVPAYVDPASAGVLREVNRHAEEPLPHQARLALLEDWEDGQYPAASPAPRHELGAFAPLVERWRETAERAGHDVRGELRRILDHPDAPAPAGGPRVRLDVAARALAETLGEREELRRRVARLEREVETLDQKRRTWKRRAKQEPTLAAVS